MGATKWVRTGEDTVTGHHQIRAAHVRYTDRDLQRLDRRGHSHASNEHYYRKIDGVWKFAGLKPTVRFNEFDFDLIFKGIPNVESIGRARPQLFSLASPIVTSTPIFPLSSPFAPRSGLPE